MEREKRQQQVTGVVGLLLVIILLGIGGTAFLVTQINSTNATATVQKLAALSTQDGYSTATAQFFINATITVQHIQAEQANATATVLAPIINQTSTQSAAQTNVVLFANQTNAAISANQTGVAASAEQTNAAHSATQTTAFTIDNQQSELSNRYRAPVNAVLLNGGRGLSDGSRMNQGTFQIEGYCTRLGYSSANTNNQDWFCENRSGKTEKLGIADLDAICQITYNDDAAFAIQDGNNTIMAYNWRCYSFVSARASSSSTSSTQHCRGTPESIVYVGARLSVSKTDPPTLRLRANPSTNAQVVIVMDSKTPIFEVIGGPECADGYTWWQVRLRDGRVGYIAEGDSSGYFVDVH